MSAPIRVAIVTNMWPHERRPTFGVFVAEQVDALRALPDLQVGVLPLGPIGSRLRYLDGARVARRLRWGFDIVHVHHPFALGALATRR